MTEAQSYSQKVHSCSIKHCCLSHLTYSINTYNRLSCAWLLWYTLACQLLHEKTLCSSGLWSNLAVQIEGLNKPLPRGEGRKTDKVRGQPGSSISLCAGRETARPVGGRHNQTKTQIENRQGQEDTETGEWVHLLLLLCNAVATVHRYRRQSCEYTEPHLAPVAARNDRVLLHLTGNYGDTAHHEVSAAAVLCTDTPGHGLALDTIRQSGRGWKGCKDTWGAGLC